MLTNRKFVIFDMDGILFDTELLMIRCYETVAAEYSMPDVASVCRKCIGVNAIKTQEIFYEHYGDSFPLSEIRNKVVALFRHTTETEGVPIKPYAEELLKYLKASGYALALASSTATEIVIRELKQSGFYDYFDQIIGGDMVTNSKPAPDIFLVACEKLGSIPGNTYVIEDSQNGIRAAYAAGAMPMAVPDLFALPKEIQALCTGVFSDLSAVLTFFESLSSTNPSK